MNITSVEKKQELLVEIKNLKTNLKTSDGIVTVVDDVSLSIKKGEIIALVGESGSGKSMTVNSMLRMVPKTLLHSYEGSITVNGKNIFNLKEKEMVKIRGNQISMVAQNAMTALDPSYTIGSQIIEIIKAKTLFRGRNATNRALELLEQAGIDEAMRVFSSYSHQLSGGLRQRAVIAMALACEPDVIIADEPTSALDPTVQIQVLDLFKEINEKFGTSILIITHDFGVVSRIADRVAVMYAGQIVEQGNTKEIVFNPLHPYTQSLLRCIPDLSWIFDKTDKQPLEQIHGEPPNLLTFEGGCRFASRCKEVETNCKTSNPALIRKRNENLVRCLKR